MNSFVQLYREVSIYLSLLAFQSWSDPRHLSTGALINWWAVLLLLLCCNENVWGIHTVYTKVIISLLNCVLYAPTRRHRGRRCGEILNPTVHTRSGQGNNVPVVCLLLFSLECVFLTSFFKALAPLLNKALKIVSFPTHSWKLCSQCKAKADKLVCFLFVVPNALHTHTPSCFTRETNHRYNQVRYSWM